MSSIVSKGNCFTSLLILIVILCSRGLVYSQPIANSQGKQFFVAFMPNVHDTIFSRDSLRLFFTGKKDIVVTVNAQSRTGANATKTVTLDANGFGALAFRWQEYEPLGMSIANGRMKNGDNGTIGLPYFSVSAPEPITVNALNQADLTSDAALIYPIEALGKEYKIMAYNSDGFKNMLEPSLLDDRSTASQAIILATEDNTKVDVQSSVSLVGRNTQSFTVTLQKGESCLLQALITLSALSPDISNTIVKADKPIAVFAGHQRSPVPDTLLTSRDHLFEQMPPLELWGNEFFVAPIDISSINSVPNDRVRIISQFDNTEIIINGALTKVMSRSEVYTIKAVGPMRIFASAPILVGFMKGTAVSAAPPRDGDPAFMIVPPSRQYRKEYLVAHPLFVGTKESTNSKVYLSNFLTVIIANRAKNSLLLNGKKITAETQFKNFASSTTGKNCLEYVYAHIKVNDGTNLLTASESFGCFVSGYGYLDSYMFWGGIQPIPDTKPPFPSLTAKGDTTLCFGLTAPLTVTGGNGTYKWTPSNTLDCPTCASVNANPRKSTRYIVESKDVFDCPIFDTVWVNRTFFQGGKVCNDTAVCLGAKAQLYASDAHRYEWYGDPSLSCNHCPNPTVAPRKKTKIYVRLYDVTGCLRLDSVTVDITLLQATAGPDRSICPGSNVELNATGGDIYTWRKDPTLSCTDCPNPIASPLKKTIYYVHIQTKEGCYRDDTVIVDTKALVTELGNDTTVCSGMSVRLQPIGGKTFQWRPDPTLSCSDCPTPLATPTQKTTYYVTAYDQTCIAKDSITISVDGVKADAGADTAVCKGEAIALTASKGIRYQWRKHPTLICDDCRTTIVKPTETTTYYVRIYQTPDCSAEDSVTVTVKNFTITASDDVTLCAQDSVQLSAVGTQSYFWYPAEGLSCTQCPNPIAKPKTTTTYYVQGNQSAQCFAIDSVTITLTSMNTTITPSHTICQGQSSTLTASGGKRYRWYGASDIQCSDCPETLVKPTQTTTYYVEINDDYCKKTDSVTIQLSDHTIAIGNDTILCQGQQIMLNCSPSPRYDWFPKDGSLSCYDCPSPLASPSQTTTYYCIATNEYGCTATDSLSITVKSCTQTMTIDMGTTTACKSIARMITITNPHKNKPVTLTVTMPSTNSDAFSINPANFPVQFAADEAKQFAITYAPTTFGNHSADYIFRFSTGEELHYHIFGNHQPTTMQLTANDTAAIEPGKPITLTINALADDWNHIQADSLRLTIHYPARMMARSSQPITTGTINADWNIQETIQNQGQNQYIHLDLNGTELRNNGTIVHIPFTVFLADSLQYHIFINGITGNCFTIQPAQATVSVTSCFAQGRLISTSDTKYSATIDQTAGNIIVRYSLGFASSTAITLYNAMGEKVATLLQDMVPKGEHTLNYTQQTLPHGLYYLHFNASTYSVMLPFLH